MTWDEFRKQRAEEQKRTRNFRYKETDIECPVCGARIFRDDMIVLTSNPPQHRYLCMECEWSGCTY